MTATGGIPWMGRLCQQGKNRQAPTPPASGDGHPGNPGLPNAKDAVRRLPALFTAVRVGSQCRQRQLC